MNTMTNNQLHYHVGRLSLSLGLPALYIAADARETGRQFDTGDITRFLPPPRRQRCSRRGAKQEDVSEADF